MFHVSSPRTEKVERDEAKYGALRGSQLSRGRNMLLLLQLLTVAAAASH